MVQWDKSEVEQKNNDRSTSKATLMMPDQNNNQSTRLNGSVAMNRQRQQLVQAQAPAPAVRRGPYVPPPPKEQFRVTADMQQADVALENGNIQQPRQVAIGKPLEKAVIQTSSASMLSKMSILKPYCAKVMKDLSLLKREDLHKMAIGLVAYLFLIGGAVSGAVVGGDRFFKFLSSHMYDMSSDMNADQIQRGMKTASLKR
ncbi:hypothetical protein [Cohaesibacter gelatinilyticus]|uniref:Uncharacterized protein n=1 Tax=Cohaesibacter gelatinilyticus TaxID=372072 RepID=A0A285NI17_9HYPH|nr:hypothetical protein [Cohaesibacter gelatinilyticus]SNZ07301.1 hypothetical protein SAMN06265368_0819 [Cohaesibacter gelatinilyticus]